MRIQASMEFLILASAISVLCLGTIVMYGSSIGAQNAFVGGLYANSLDSNILASNTLAAAAEDPSALIYVPVNSTVGQQGRIEATFYGCTNGTASLSANSPTLAFSTASDNSISVSGVSVASLAFTPASSGLASVLVDYAMQCGAQRITGSKAFDTFAIVPGAFDAGGGNGTGFTDYAAITGRSERLAYALTPPSSIPVTQSQNHCANMGLNNQLNPPASQCGNEPGWSGNGGWGYFQYNGGCSGWGIAEATVTCIEPVPSGYEIATTSPQNVTYLYNFSLSVSTQKGLLTAAFSNSSKIAPVDFDGMAVGNATVVNVTGSGTSQGVAVIEYNGANTIANPGNYTAFVQAKNNLYATLGYFNATYFGYGTSPSQPQEALSQYQSAEDAVVKGSQASGSCALQRQGYVCGSPFPLSYVVRISLPPGAGVANAVVSDDGSLIYLNTT